ncbi:MAG: hypothetical protein P1U32_05090 [Legionellaceae bacterium]|nr:hypothetical protein [Legionellaceae bacterium]
MHHSNIQPLTQQVFFIADLEKLIGRNRLTLRRWWMEGKFPKPSKLNGILAWRAAAIEAWINQNLN